MFVDLRQNEEFLRLETEHFEDFVLDRLPDEVRERLLARRDRRMTDAGVMVIQARRFRDQGRNRDDARDRLVDVIREATVVAMPIRSTTPMSTGVFVASSMARRRIATWICR